MTNSPRTPKSPLRLINDLMSHLYFLRGSLIASFSQAIYYKELATQLRVLVYEKPGSRTYNPLLSILADKYGVQHEVTLNVPFPSQGYPFKTPGGGSVSFRDYLALQVFGGGGKEVSGSQLIVDVASQTGSAHEDVSVSEYLPIASAPIRGVPYHLEILQEIGLHTLRFGEDVVQKAISIEGRPTADNLEGEPLAPTPDCVSCHAEIKYDEFVCPKCGHKHLSRSPRPNLADQFATMLKTAGGILGSPANLLGWYSIPQLFDRSAGRGIILDYSEGELRLTLTRTQDFRLEFCRQTEASINCAQIELDKVVPSVWIFLALVWSTDKLGLYLASGGQLHSSEVVL